jgi:hypothetical protein
MWVAYSLFSVARVGKPFRAVWDAIVFRSGMDHYLSRAGETWRRKMGRRPQRGFRGCPGITSRRGAVESAGLIDDRTICVKTKEKPWTMA